MKLILKTTNLGHDFNYDPDCNFMNHSGHSTQLSMGFQTMHVLAEFTGARKNADFARGPLVVAESQWKLSINGSVNRKLNCF